MPSRSSLLASVGHIGINRDPRAPVHLDVDEQDAALADQNIVCLEARIKSLGISIYKEHSRLKYKTTTDEAQKKHLRKLQRSRQPLRKRLLKEAADEKRIRFSTISIATTSVKPNMAFRCTTGPLSRSTP